MRLYRVFFPEGCRDEESEACSLDVHGVLDLERKGRFTFYANEICFDLNFADLLCAGFEEGWSK